MSEIEETRENWDNQDDMQRIIDHEEFSIPPPSETTTTTNDEIRRSLLRSTVGRLALRMFYGLCVFFQGVRERKKFALAFLTLLWASSLATSNFRWSSSVTNTSRTSSNHHNQGATTTAPLVAGGTTTIPLTATTSKGTANTMENFHRDYPRHCGDKTPTIHPGTIPLFETIHRLYDRQPWYRSWSTIQLLFTRKDKHFHHQKSSSSSSSDRGEMEQLTDMQVCMYSALDRWKQLAAEYNMTRWSAHGGSVLGAKCFHSMNPWDDDIDLTLENCDQLKHIFDHVARKTPSSWSTYWYTTKLLDDDWIIMKLHWRKWLVGSQHWNWYKIKPLVQMEVLPTNDPSGIDIGCLHADSRTENKPMLDSGYTDYLMSDRTLQDVEFGPTTVNMIPDEVADAYIMERYGTDDPCGFPYNKDPLYAIRQKYPKPTFVNVNDPSDDFGFAVDTWYIPLGARMGWASQIGQISGKQLTNDLANLTRLEIDNSISQSCRMETSLKVIEFNAERGTRWSEFARMIQDPTSPLHGADVIILNEMDIGMARSGNVHTTRKLAYELDMNYAWGLEFVELSRGTKSEQDSTRGQENLLGLHGNAILSKCPLYDPLVVREEFDSGFFTKKSLRINAHGYEQRLGSRMGMYLRMSPDPLDENQPHVVVGSIHKISAKKHRQILRGYFGIDTGDDKTKAVGTIVAGDNKRAEFRGLGLSEVDSAKHHTYPASCNPPLLGKKRGDFFWSNMALETPDQVVPPCLEDGGSDIMLSDHSIIVMSFKLPS